MFRRRPRRRLRRLTLLAGAGFGLAALRRRKLAENEAKLTDERAKFSEKP